MTYNELIDYVHTEVIEYVENFIDSPTVAYVSSGVYRDISLELESMRRWEYSTPSELMPTSLVLRTPFCDVRIIAVPSERPFVHVGSEKQRLALLIRRLLRRKKAYANSYG